MNIEIKKSIKPVKYDVAVKLLEERLLDINSNKKGDLIWLLEHEEVYTGGNNYKEDEILNKNIKHVEYPWMDQTWQSEQYTVFLDQAE